MNYSGKTLFYSEVTKAQTIAKCFGCSYGIFCNFMSLHPSPHFGRLASTKKIYHISKLSVLWDNVFWTSSKNADIPSSPLTVQRALYSSLECHTICEKKQTQVLPFIKKTNDKGNFLSQSICLPYCNLEYLLDFFCQIKYSSYKIFIIISLIMYFAFSITKVWGRLKTPAWNLYNNKGNSSNV